MSANKQDYVSPMQHAFMAAVVVGRPGRSHARVLRVLDRTKPLQVRGWNANVSFRTAQKLKQQGVLS